MVKVREEYGVTGNGDVDIDRWVQHIAELTHLEKPEELRLACEKAALIALQAFREDRLWTPGSSSFRTGLEMAQVLAELHMDQTSLVAAVHYRSVREERVALEENRKELGDEGAGLINGVQQMAAISSIHHPLAGNVLGQSEGQLDNVRRMLVTMVDDVRVALIKLAERTCAIRAVKDAPQEKRMRVAREVFDIYAPLAHRLGIGHIKWELEDLSFRYLHASAYKKIAKLLNEKRLDRESYIRRVIDTLQTELKASGIKGDLSGRAKHIYSIWRKMRRKGIDFSQVYDVRAVRILVPEVRDCYAALGIVHTLWRHIPNEFDDYIANPKENGYQSLHTAVIGPEGKVMEVQIRTHAMHEEAELGVCAHWLYKGTDKNNKSSGYDAKINWLRQVLEWQEELGDISGLADHLRVDFEPDRIYLFTPDGHVLDVPRGATPLDFAYRVHTEIGHNCRGAKVNGRIVPLNYVLQTGEQVEIITGRTGGPSRDWLNPNLGYVNTSRARAKVQHWFKQQAREQNVQAGKVMLERELARMALTGTDYAQLIERLGIRSQEDLFAALGSGDIRLNHVVNVAHQLVEPDRHAEQLELIPRRQQKSGRRGDVHIQGVGNLLTQLAGCCQPVPGDPIIGYITVGRGVTVHRADCATALQLQDRESERLIEVSWGGEPVQTYPVEIFIKAYDRSGLLRDVSQLLANEKINVLEASTRTNRDDNYASMMLTLEVPNLHLLGRLLTRIGQLPNVIEARRNRQERRA